MQVTPATDPNRNTDGCYKGSCKHSPLLALLKMNKTSVIHYTSVGEFLNGSSCLDCKKDTNLIPASKVDGTVVYYCDDANKGFMAKRDDKVSEQARNDLICTMVLCEGCFIKRPEVQGGAKGGGGELQFD